MARRIEAFKDNKGTLHADLRSATIADLAALFGNTEGMSHGIATTLFEQRSKFEKLFKEYDDITAPTCVAYPEDR